MLPRITKTTALLAGCFLALPLAVNADPDLETDSAPATNREPITVTSKPELVPGLPPLSRIYVSAGVQEFALLTPAGYRSDTTSQDLVHLVNGDYDCFITFRFATQDSAASKGLDAGTCRKLLTDRYPGAKITEELTLEAGGKSGPAFDFQWQGYGGTTRSSRVVYVPSSAGIMEFSLICDSSSFNESKYAFNALLLTFRASDASGKLDITPLSNKL